jgi:ribonuclease HI
LGPFLFHIGLGFASDLHEKTDPRAPKRLPRLTICGLLTNIVVPMVSYGCHLFADKLNNVTLQKELSRLNRIACLSLGSVPPGTPTATMGILFNLRPLDLEMERIAIKTFFRIKNKLPHIWDGRPTGGGARVGHFRYWHNKIKQYNIAVNEIDNNQLVKSWTRNFEVLDFETTWNDALDQWGTWTCYTDGSKLGKNLGYGYLINRFGHTIYEGHNHMSSRATVFMTEIRAITTVAHTLMQRKNQKIIIRCDSQAAILAIKNINISSKTVLECRKLLNQLGARNSLKICWIKAHAAHPGNEMADRLAKMGANQTIGPARFKYYEAVASFNQSLIARSNQKWQERWDEDPSKYMQSKGLIIWSLLSRRLVVATTTKPNLRHLAPASEVAGRHTLPF